MNCRKSFLIGWFAVLSLLFVLSGSSTLAQNTKPGDDRQTIQALLNEVRLLRRTLQQTGLNAYRSQLIVEGMRAHNEKAERLTRLLEDVRDEIERIGITIPRMTEQAKVLETMVEQEMDANKRVRLEFEAKDMRRSIEQFKMRLERQREREQPLAAKLRAEQTKLEELEGRLDALEREIQTEIMRQQSEDASNEGKKRPV